MAGNRVPLALPHLADVISSWQCVGGRAACLPAGEQGTPVQFRDGPAAVTERHQARPFLAIVAVPSGAIRDEKAGRCSSSEVRRPTNT